MTFFHMTQNEKERNVDIFRSHQFAPFFLTIRYHQNKKLRSALFPFSPSLAPWVSAAQSKPRSLRP